MSRDRIGVNADNSLDEIVASGVQVHVEQMSDTHWWIGIYRMGDFRASLMLNLHSTKKIVAGWDDEGLALPIHKDAT